MSDPLQDTVIVGSDDTVAVESPQPSPSMVGAEVGQVNESQFSGPAKAPDVSPRPLVDPAQLREADAVKSAGKLIKVRQSLSAFLNRGSKQASESFPPSSASKLDTASRDPSPIEDSLRKIGETVVSRRKFITTTAVLAGGAVVAEKTGTLGKIGKWWVEEGKEYDREQAAKAAAKQEAAATEAAKTPEPTLSSKELAEQEANGEADQVWGEYSVLRSHENIGREEGLSLLPAVSAGNSTEAVLEKFEDVYKKNDKNELVASVLTPVILEKNIDTDKAAEVFDESLRKTDNGLASYKDEAAQMTNIALRFDKSAEEVFQQRDDLKDVFSSEDAAMAFLPLVYSGYSVESIKDAWDRVREVTEDRGYDKGVDELLTVGKLLSGESADSLNDSFVETRNQIDERYDMEAGQIAIAKLVSGDSERIMNLYKRFSDHVDKDGAKSVIASSLTLETVLRNPNLSAAQQLQGIQGTSPYVYYRFFIDPQSPLSPFRRRGKYG